MIDCWRRDVVVTQRSDHFVTKFTLHFPKTGLVEFEFRKYAPNAGRWMSRDPLHEDIETEFGSIDIGVALVEPYNQYCGLGNNPVRLIDADGLFAQYLPAAIKIGTELGRMAVAGVAAALVTVAATEAVKKCPQPRCNPCDPPVGTKGYRFEQVPPGKPHWPISGSHVHFYEVNQSPVYNGCGCFWHNLNETVASDSPPKGMVNIKNNPVRGGGIRYD